MKEAALSLRDVQRCQDARCDCRARGTLAVVGYGETIAALYDDSRGIRASAGRTSGGRRGHLTAADFDSGDIQRVIIAAFHAALLGSELEALQNPEEVRSL